MSDRIDEIREKALKDYDSSRKDLSGPRKYYEYGAIFGATEVLTYTDEDVERAARDMHEEVQKNYLGDRPIRWETLEQVSPGAADSWRYAAVATLESFGARREHNDHS